MFGNGQVFLVKNLMKGGELKMKPENPLMSQVVSFH